MSLSLETGVDFLYAHLHGWWAASAQGSRLEELSRAATPENFIVSLGRMGIASISDPEKVLDALLIRHHQRLRQLGRMVEPRVLAYLRSQQEAIEAENLKTLLNYRFFPERIGSYSDVLVRFPNAMTSYDNIETLLAATTTEQFIRALPPQMPHLDEVSRIVRTLDQDRNIMHAECSVDNLAFRHELEAAQHLPGAMRGVALELLTGEIDLTNLMTLLRNANFYHMPVDSLQLAWIDGGRDLPLTLWRHIATEKDSGKAATMLPAPFAGIIRQHIGQPLNQIENLLRCRLMRQACRHFYNASNPALAIPAYTWMLRFETVNLGRVYEGIRFSLPVRAIQEMLIQ